MEVIVVKGNNNKYKLITPKKKVAAYARVSTAFEKQEISYESQIKYYQEKIKRNMNWELVKIYSDYGISGTQIDKRAEFLQMIEDAMNGKINLILTKSISRFARNTADTLSFIRLLKENGVEVYFEEENISTFNFNCELLLTTLAAVAQQESLIKSEHIKLGLHILISGGSNITRQRFFGYDIDYKNRMYIVNKKEAEIVKTIYNLFLEGYSTMAIAKILNERKVKNIRNSTQWNANNIKYILTNEKYIGDVLQGKTYTVNPIEHERKINLGEKDKYIIRNHHEAIISRADFNKVQRIIKENARKKSKSDKPEIGRSIFYKKLKCGFDGYNFNKHVTDKKIGYRCTVKGKLYSRCNNSIYLYDDILKAIFLETLNNLIKSKYDITKNKINKSIIEKMNKRKNFIEKEKIKLLDLYMGNKINGFYYKHKNNELDEQLNNIKSKLKSTYGQYDFENSIKNQIKAIQKIILNSDTNVKEFNIDLFNELVDFVIIGGKNEKGKKAPCLIRFICNDKSKFILNKDISNNMVLQNSLDSKNNEYFAILDFYSNLTRKYYQHHRNGTKSEHYSRFRVRVELKKVN